MRSLDKTSLTVVIPTFNERGNVAELVARLDRTLNHLRWEIIFVDDCSSDGTAELVREMSTRDPRIRLILRHNRRGLSSAVVEGALAASADLIAVMDGDLQHDESVLPDLYAAVERGDGDIALASRFLTQNGADGLSSETRQRVSTTGIRLANGLFGLSLTDPLTGFFVVRRDVVIDALPELSEIGFKILLDLIVTSRPRPKVVEIPFQFRKRIRGESKLDNRVIYDFFLFFIEKKIARFLPLPARFISFALINSFGILVNLAVLLAVMESLRPSFESAVLTATMVSVMFNYWANNTLTFRDRRLTGVKFYFGLIAFAALSSVGIIADLGVASMLYTDLDRLSYLVPATLGALLTVVWNYVATNAFVWGQGRIVGGQAARLRKYAASTPHRSPVTSTGAHQ